MLTKVQETLLENKIKNLQSELTKRQERKRQKESLNKILIELQALLKDIKEEERNYKQARLFVIKFQNDKRLKDAETIRQAMNVASELILTEHQIKPKFKHTTGRYPESKLVVESGTKEVLLELREGTGVSESVSLLTLLSVLFSTQYIKTCLLDEYFSSVSQSNSERISGKLNDLVDGKLQLILTEQKDAVFKHAKYREFFVKHDGIQSHVTTYEVDEFGNKTLVEE